VIVLVSKIRLLHYIFSHHDNSVIPVNPVKHLQLKTKENFTKIVSCKTAQTICGVILSVTHCNLAICLVTRSLNTVIGFVAYDSVVSYDPIQAVHIGIAL